MQDEKPISAGKCCTCGCRVWLTPSHYYAAMEGRSKITFHCGYGHAQHFANEDDEIVKIRRERDRYLQQLAQKDDRIADLVKETDTLKADAERMKRRVSAGVCPCCNRTFRQLTAHMKSQHPLYVRLGKAA